MTTGVSCPGCGIYLVGNPGQQCVTCQLQAGPGLGRELWLRFLRVIDGGEIEVGIRPGFGPCEANREAGS